MSSSLNTHLPGAPAAPRAHLFGTTEALGGLLAVFVSPFRLFERLRARPSWIAPLVAAIAVGILVIVALPDQVFVDGMQGATTRRGVPVEITSAPEVVAHWERLRLGLGVAVTHPIKVLLLAGLCTAAFGRRDGARDVGFVHHFALAAHVLLISALGALVVLPFQVAAADPTLAASVGLVIPGLEAYGLVGRLIAAVNPFTAWMLAAAAMGVGVLERRPVALPLFVLGALYLALLGGVAALRG